MKLSCLPVSLYKDIFNGEKSVLDWVHLGADLGLDGIDVGGDFFGQLGGVQRHLSVPVEAAAGGEDIAVF